MGLIGRPVDRGGGSMIKNPTTIILYLLLVSTVWTVAADASPRIDFSDTVREGEIELRRRGTGTLTYLVFYDAYSGAFYLPDGVPSQKALSAVPRFLVLEYFHSIKAEDFAEATTKKIRDNVEDDAFSALKPRIDRFNALYRDVKPGDRYALLYLPGRGTTLKLNGTALGMIEGDDFARAVFSIWLGQAPIDEAFKRRLLGES
jgi:hypothetical protein